MSDLDDELKEVRAELDSLDEELVALVNRRARLAQQIGQTKAVRGLRVYAPDRERQVLDRIGRIREERLLVSDGHRQKMADRDLFEVIVGFRLPLREEIQDLLVDALEEAVLDGDPRER